MTRRLTITPKELLQVVEACGGLKGFPSHTQHPRVNYLVDCAVNQSLGEQIEQYDEGLYIEEVKAAKGT